MVQKWTFKRNQLTITYHFILYSFVQKSTEVSYFAPQIAGKLVVAGQDKYMNNKGYLIKQKTLN